MIRYWVFLLFVIFSTSCYNVDAQTAPLEKCIWIKDFNFFKPDSLSIIPESIRLEGLYVDQYKIDYQLSTGYLKITLLKPKDSVLLCYKTLAIAFHQPLFLRNPQEYDSNALFFNKSSPSQLKLLPREELFATESIQKSGSLSRGISIGNTQNVFVNSNFNLQLEGKLTDDLNIRAAITDQNIPYQPEGNSQRVQDFDNVFVQIYNDKLSLIAGDVVFRNKPSQYLRYYKNVQGIYGTYQLNNRIGKSETAIGASLAKGKFASIQLDIQEGVSGPYRLRGADNERFIIVLANSEKIFIDGRQLQRGFDFDYVVDYNTGEITFSNRVLITKYSRVRVDFEYAIQNYARTIMQANHYQEGNKLDFFVNYYQEKDNRNRPLFYDLTNIDKQILSDAGDDLNAAVVSGIDSVGFEPNRILYIKKDTVDADGNIVSNIYEYSSSSESAIYRLSFTELGQGNGNYILGDNTLNGRVYLWVSPLNGVPQGSFEPVVLLAAPSMKQMINVGAQYELTKNDLIKAEIARASQDLNLYSDLGAEDDKGNAYMLAYEKSGITLINRELFFSTNAEILEKNFRPIDRFRDIDFDRDWNMPLIYNAAEEQIYSFKTSLIKDANHQFSYKLTNRNRVGQINGWQHQIKINEAFSRWNNIIDANSLQASQVGLATQWNRLNVQTFWKGDKWMPGYQLTLDHNKNYKSGTDSLVALYNAFHFYENKFFIRSGDSLSGSFLIDYSIRRDKSPLMGELTDADDAQTFNLAWVSEVHEKSNWSTQFTYRTLSNLLDSLETKEETILGRLDWTWRPVPRAIRTDFTYAISNGRELKREYSYFQVATGEGTHTWVDQNENGIQELNEFFEAITFDQKNYVKIFTPTDEYITAYSQIFNYRVSLDAPTNWRTQSGILKLLSRFSNISFWNLDRKTTDTQLIARLLPFYQLEDSNLISNKSIMRTTTFINKSHPLWGADFTFGKSNYKQLLNAGFESRQIEDYKLNYRINFSADWSAKLLSAKTLRKSNSDFLLGRNYTIQHYSLSPELSWQPKADFRLTVAYLWSDKLNLIGKEDQASFNEFILETRWATTNQTNVNGRLKLSEIIFEGTESSAVAFEMLEALRPGSNISWNINWLQRLSNGLQLTFTYEGRKSPNIPAVNIGRAQVTLLF